MQHNVANPRNDLTPEFVRQHFGYDHEAGRLTKNGDYVGWVHSTGYRYVSIDGREYKEHRLIWVLVTGVWPENQIDHKNGVRADNRFENLRDVTGTINQRNRSKLRNNSSGYRGVTFKRSNRRFMAQIRLERGRKFLGYFDTAKAASRAYEAALAAVPH